MQQEQRQWLRLHLTKGLGRIGLIRIREAFKTPAAALEASPGELAARAGLRSGAACSIPDENDPLYLQTLERLECDNVRIVCLWDEDYPPLLRQIHDPPALLYVRGHLPAGDGLAVVGSRRASEGGRVFTERLCRELSAAGFAIVSGLARGVDTAAHRGALNESGVTVGVLGCGIDRVYPPENKRLFQEVLERGAIVSEYPPGTEPLPGHFPARNRIISGLCRGVAIVEAAQDSGSLITADFALEQGREVFAVPGAVGSPNSFGPHRLLKEGAALVTEAADILDVLAPGACGGPRAAERVDAAENLSGNTLEVYRTLEEGAVHVDEIIRRSGLTPMDVSDILLHLELEGAVEGLPGLRYVRR